MDPTKGRREAGLFWMEGSAWGRNLIDSLRDDLTPWEVWDYKTSAGTIDPQSMALSVHFVEMGYATQCAMQQRGLEALYPTLAGRIKFRRLFQMSEPPYLISVVEPDPATMMIAHKQVSRAFFLWEACLTSGEWPSYPRTVVTLRHAEFLSARWLEREVAEGMPPEEPPPMKRRPGRPPKTPTDILAAG